MGIILASTPFGSRPMTFAQLASQKSVDKIAKDANVDKWQIHRWLCETKLSFGLNDRSLAVLAGLLSFYPEQHLNLKHGLVVFPSNKQLALRSHGMAEATLRRHLSTLVDAGIILRQDSPNGKRYAHRTKEGGIGNAYGFSLAPLLARAGEFKVEAERIKAELQELRTMREQLSLLRRDIAKLIDLAISEQISGSWEVFHQRFRTVVDAIPRRATVQELSALTDQLAQLHQEIDKALIDNKKTQEMSGNESQNERHQYESDSDSQLKETAQFANKSETVKNNICSLDLILKACPEINSYWSLPIRSWQDFAKAAETIRSFLGIDNSIYDTTQRQLGVQNASALVAYLLQRVDHIRSAPAYLRTLAKKLIDGQTSVQLLMQTVLKEKIASRCGKADHQSDYRNLSMGFVS